MSAELLKQYKAKLKTLEEKLAKLKSGELEVSEQEGEEKEERHNATIARTELFIRNVKKEIQRLSPAPAETPVSSVNPTKKLR